MHMKAHISSDSRHGLKFPDPEQTANVLCIWVLLFVSLFLYTIKRYERMEEKQELRETEYQNLLNTLTQNLSVLSDVKEDVKEIKQKLIFPSK